MKNLIQKIKDDIAFWRHFKLSPGDGNKEQRARFRVNGKRVEIVMCKICCPGDLWACGVCMCKKNIVDCTEKGDFRRVKEAYKRLWLGLRRASNAGRDKTFCIRGGKQ